MCADQHLDHVPAELDAIQTSASACLADLQLSLVSAGA